MLTRLQKALGLKPPALSDHEARLQALVLKGQCAGDDYYFTMSESSFAACMKGDEGEDFHRHYTRQRAVGIEAFQHEVTAELAHCSGSDVDFIARRQGYNGSKWFLLRLVEHPQCELATARFVYWASQPADVYRCYGSIENALADRDSLAHGRALLLHAIEQRARGAGFPRTLALTDLSCFVDDDAAAARAACERMPPLLQL